jgi:transcriptional regulator with XRE-family HTH domain
MLQDCGEGNPAPQGAGRRFNSAMEKEQYRWSVRHAAEMVGGYEELAERLRIGKAVVSQWAAGDDIPDTMQFLFLLDLIMVETDRLSRAVMASALAEAAIAKAGHTSKDHIATRLRGHEAG